MEDVAISRLRVVESYRTDDPHPALRNNQMALDFPPPLSDAELFTALARYPEPRPDNFESLPLNDRLERCKDIEHLHLPFDTDMLVLRNVISTVRASFIARNPNDPEVMRFIIRASQGYEGAVPRLSQAGGGGGLGLLLTGPSGTGKTSTSDRVVATLDGRARIHLSLRGKPCRWLQLGVIRVAVGETWKETLDAILLDVDSKLDRDSLVRRAKSPTRRDLSRAVFQALSSGFAPLLILDEMQTIKGLTRAAAKEILKGLINLMEAGGIPVMIIGTVAVRELFNTFPTQMSKFLNTGDIRCPPLVRGSLEWLQFADTLKGFSVSTKPIQYAATFDDDLYLHTMGIKRFAREVMKAVFTRHALNENLVADRAMLDDIAKNELQGFQRAIGVLRNAALKFDLDYHTYRQYEDNLPTEAERFSSEPSKLVQQRWLAENQIDPLGRRPHLSASEFVRLELEIAEEAARAAQRRNAQKQAPQPASPRVAPPKPTQAVGDRAAPDEPGANGPAARVDVAGTLAKKSQSRMGKSAADPGPDDLPRVDPLKLR